MSRTTVMTLPAKVSPRGLYAMIYVLLLIGGIEPNPGPTFETRCELCAALYGSLAQHVEMRELQLREDRRVVEELDRSLKERENNLRMWEEVLKEREIMREQLEEALEKRVKNAERTCEDRKNEVEKACKDREKVFEQRQLACEERVKEVEKVCKDRVKEVERICKVKFEEVDRACKDREEEVEKTCNDREKVFDQRQLACEERVKEVEKVCKDRVEEVERICKDREKDREKVVEQREMMCEKRESLCRQKEREWRDREKGPRWQELLSQFDPGHEILQQTLNWAAEEGYVSVMNFLLARNPCVGWKRTALNHAAESGQLDIIKALVEEEKIQGREDCVSFGRCDINVNIGTHSQGLPALLLAAKEGHVEVVRYLVEEVLGNALVAAAEWGHLELVRYLLEEGARSEEALGNAFVKALQWGHSEVVTHLTEFLVEEGFASREEILEVLQMIEIGRELQGALLSAVQYPCVVL